MTLSSMLPPWHVPWESPLSCVRWDIATHCRDFPRFPPLPVRQATEITIFFWRISLVFVDLTLSDHCGPATCTTLCPNLICQKCIFCPC